MKTFQINPEWQLSLPTDFKHRREDAHIIFWKTGITIICTVFSYSGEAGRATMLANLKARAEAEGRNVVQSDEGELRKLGYVQIEELNEDQMRLVLYSFTAAPYTCLQIAFYMDSEDSFEDMLELWKAVKHCNPEANGKENE